MSGVAKELLIDDSYDVNPDQLAGLCGTKPRDFSLVPVGSLAFAAEPTFTLIPQSEWADRARQMEKDQSRLSDLILDAGVPCLNQQQTSYCHANSPCEAIMILRAVEGQPFELLSPASIGGPVTNFQNEGAFIHDDLKQIVTVGCASQKFVPANQIGKSGFKTGWEADAGKHKVLEWYDFGRKDGAMLGKVVTALLSRIPVCVAYNWWGHAVTLIDVAILPNGQLGFRFRNSWGNDWPKNGAKGFALLDMTKGNPDEAYAPGSVVISA